MVVITLVTYTSSQMPELLVQVVILVVIHLQAG